MRLSIIVAIAENRAIGKDNDLLWHLADDLKRFKRITLEHTILMGSNTWLSLPRRPLPKRRHIVLSEVDGPDFAGADVAKSIPEALELCKDDKEVFVIGGGSVYAQMLPFADKLYITRVLQSYDGDTFFPEIDEAVWQLSDESSVLKDVNTGLKYIYQTYVKKGN